MKRVMLAVVAALSLVGVGVGLAGTSPDGLPKNTSVFGGGHFVFNTGRNFSLTASKGVGTLQYGVARIRAEVTCLNVSGNAAAVGGIIRDSIEPSIVGDLWYMHLVDNGPPVGQATGGDTVSPIMILEPSADPGGLPKSCPAPDPSQAVYALDAGDILVHSSS